MRFPRSLCFALLGAASVGCSGGGGGGSSPIVSPTLISASFDGSGPSPAAGDRLVLSFSENMTNVTGQSITGAQLTLSGNATLGTDTVVSDQPLPNALRLTLGTGADFVPGVTTVQIAASNTVFRNLTGVAGVPDGPVLIDIGDNNPPSINNVTLAAVSDPLNGTGTAGGTLQTPRTGWTINLNWSDAGLGVDPSRTRITASVPVSTTAGSQLPGIDLMPYLTEVTATLAEGVYLVPATTLFPQSPVTLSVIAVDNSGLASAPATFLFTVRAFTPALQPFETTSNSSQVWYLDTTRDIESFQTLPVPGGGQILSIAGSNGRSDYVDLLFALGLQSATPAPAGGSDTNEVVQSRLRDEMLDNLNSLFSGCNITFTYSQPAGSFGGNSNLPYDSFGYSQICIAGSADTPGVLGVAQLDPNNDRQNDNCTLESFNSNRLGVFLHTIANNELGPPSSSTFRQVFDNFTPVNGGSPIGNLPQDGDRVLGILNDSRTSSIDAAISDLARFSSIVIAHECSHSMGLVINGPMPIGLYGNDPVNFPGSTDGHIQNFALPGNGTNVMSPALSYVGAINLNTAFNSLNIAYLREQVFYGN